MIRNQITNLSRWITTKEEHAQNSRCNITIFLTQRIKQNSKIMKMN